MHTVTTLASLLVPASRSALHSHGHCLIFSCTCRKGSPECTWLKVKAMVLLFRSVKQCRVVKQCRLAHLHTNNPNTWSISAVDLAGPQPPIAINASTGIQLNRTRRHNMLRLLKRKCYIFSCLRFYRWALFHNSGVTWHKKVKWHTQHAKLKTCVAICEEDVIEGVQVGLSETYWADISPIKVTSDSYCNTDPIHENCKWWQTVVTDGARWYWSGRKASRTQTKYGNLAQVLA